MEEERREVYQEQQETEVPAEAAPEPQRRGGWWFFIGFIVGVVVVLIFTYFAWKEPLDRANNEVRDLEAQVQLANQRAERLRSALTRAQEALNALNEALQEVSPPGEKTRQAPTSGGEQTPPTQ
jgi:hypothetical protein